MIRTALRLTTIAALTGGGTNYQTLAGKQVHDSRKDDISDVIAGESMNIIVVRTDEDSRRSGDARSPLIPEYGGVVRRIALRLDIGVLTSHKDEQGNKLTGWPVTDAGLEMMLDLMEFQIENALYGNGAWAANWRKLWRRESLVSQPLWVSPDNTKTRLAMRELTYTIFSNPDCFPGFVRDDDETLVRDTNGDPVFPKTVPEPLNGVLNLLVTDATGDLAKSAIRLKSQILGQNLPTPIVAPTLKRVYLTLPAGDFFNTKANLLDAKE